MINDVVSSVLKPHKLKMLTWPFVLSLHSLLELMLHKHQPGNVNHTNSCHITNPIKVFSLSLIHTLCEHNTWSQLGVSFIA